MASVTEDPCCKAEDLETLPDRDVIAFSNACTSSARKLLSDTNHFLERPTEGITDQVPFRTPSFPSTPLLVSQSTVYLHSENRNLLLKCL